MGNSSAKKKSFTAGNKAPSTPQAVVETNKNEVEATTPTTTAAPAATTVEQPKKRLSVLGKRKSSVKAGQNSLTFTPNFKDDELVIKFEVIGGVDPTDEDYLAL